MTHAAVEFEPEHEIRREDHFVHLRGVSWADYQRVLELRGDQSAPRIAYLEGHLQIMSPSRHHERIKSLIGCLVEVWCLERNMEFSTYGSWTLEDKSADRGAEPDECYVFGARADPARPDLAIEVIWTSGGIDKLEIYRQLDVREVWIWRHGQIKPYSLEGDRYRETTASRALPGIDLEQLARFLDRPTTSSAIRDYRASLQG